MTAVEERRPPALAATGLVRHFAVSGRPPKGERPPGPRRRRAVHAVDDVSLLVPAGTTLGVVGESGCGKSSLGRLLVGLDRPDQGRIEWAGEPAGAHRGRVQAVFQDPASALDPRMTVAAAIGEALPGLRGDALGARIAELLDVVGLDPELAERFPHQLSGGQQQRVCIARAIASDPALVLLDEAVSSLDASLQAQVVELLLQLQDRTHAAYVFISHDLRAVRAVSDRIAVMYLGQIVELAPAERFDLELLHPYSVALRSAEPHLPGDGHRIERIVLQGDPPSPIDPPPGCRFASRCPVAQDRCRSEAPELVERPDGHAVRCHFPGSLTPAVLPEEQLA
ncbi:ABC transporter ATP-binding protein [Agromyces mediolanus]|uniref:oligopeptide/dipeptide ABC transporter ATP-binding protein n=1 Tax=Agromyces mediolanus TaxID=41986 RepID=UPI003834911C